MTKEKKIIFSGMQPTGAISLGNYLGALKNWSILQKQYHCIFCIVNMHSLTVRTDPKILQKNSRDLALMYIASGIDPEKNIIFYQSHVSAHAELAWILNCLTYLGELNRMTQFKDKSLKQENNINTGLFSYPVLMAADILLYGTDLVPVGQDQKQHLELTRNLAERFNTIYGETFKIPEPYIPEVGSKIMGLQDPTKKMSKSDKNANVIFLTDSPEVITKKVSKAVTSSFSDVKFDQENNPGISNLLNIYSSITNKSIQDCEKEFYGKGYAYFKNAVSETIIYEFKPIWAKYKKLCDDNNYIDSILKKNAEIAKQSANKTLEKVYKKVGLIC